MWNGFGGWLGGDLFMWSVFVVALFTAVSYNLCMRRCSHKTQDDTGVCTVDFVIYKR